jgi:hypothetical protein
MGRDGVWWGRACQVKRPRMTVLIAMCALRPADMVSDSDRDPGQATRCR